MIKFYRRYHATYYSNKTGCYYREVHVEKSFWPPFIGDVMFDLRNKLLAAGVVDPILIRIHRLGKRI
jgi:hypothetical protein